jgi:hypothetical protein
MSPVNAIVTMRGGAGGSDGGGSAGGIGGAWATSAAIGCLPDVLGGVLDGSVEAGAVEAGAVALGGAVAAGPSGCGRDAWPVACVHAADARATSTTSAAERRAGHRPMYTTIARGGHPPGAYHHRGHSVP